MERDEAYGYHHRAIAYLHARLQPSPPAAEIEVAAKEEVRIAVAVHDSGNEARVGLRVMALDEPTMAVIAEMRAVGAIPEDVEIHVVGRLVGYGPSDLVAPLQAGVSCAHRNGSPGTIGCVVKNKADDGRRFILSVNHVLALENNAGLGTDILQPFNGATSLRTIGTLDDFQTLQPAGNRMDGAIALLSIHDIDPTIFNGKRITGVRTPPLIEHEPVFKFGQASNGTSGRALASMASMVTLDMDFGTYSFDQQYEILDDGGPFAIKGDSGALVYDADDNAVGLVIGGNRVDRVYVTPIKVLLDRFQVELA